MIYFANPNSEAARDDMSRQRLGCISTPAQGNRYFADDGWVTILDNGCFSLKDRWTHERWFRWLLKQPRSVLFAVAPDVFRPDGEPCHDETLDRWRFYAPLMERHGFVPAFVCQVGCTPDTYPRDAAVLFLGGSKVNGNEWKVGEVAEAITSHAKNEGRWVHMGRVNGRKRYDIARRMRCDSADGTFLAFGPDVNHRRQAEWDEAMARRPMLWEATK